VSARRSVAIALCTLLLCACSLSRPAVEIHSYLIVPQWPQTRRDLQAIHVRVQPLEIAPQFEGKPLVYRFSDVRYEADFYNEFLVAPRIMLMEQSAEWLRRAGYDATTNGSRDAYVLRASVPAMYGDFRERERPLAVLTTRYTLTAPDTAQPILEREYAVTVPLADRSAQSVAQGLSAALTQTLTQLHAEMQMLSKR
jgi:uncharacterized lipoprotein YmbA